MTIHLKNINSFGGKGSGGGGGGATNSLYDLTTSAATKNWCTINGNSRVDLDKADVPTMYADILDKYDGVDSEQGEITYRTTANSISPQIYHNGYYYYCGNSSGDARYIYRATKIDLSDGALFVDLADKVSFVSSGGVRILKNSRYIIFVNATTSNNYSVSVVLYNLNLEYIGSFSFTNPVAFYAYNKMSYFFEDDYVYFATGDFSNLFRYNFVDCIVNNAELEIKTLSDSSERKTLFYDKDTNAMYLCKSKTLYTADFNAGTITQVYASSATAYNNAEPIVTKYNGQLILFAGQNMYKQNADTTWTGYSFNYGYGTGNRFYNIVKYNDTYYIAMSSYSDSGRNLMIYTTTDFVTFTSFFGGSSELYDVNAAHMIISNKAFACVYSPGNLSYGSKNFYAEFLPKAYTDTYVINSTETEINYYKNGGFKICVPDTTNDANLATVYAALGELPYFRLDTTGETVSPIRSKMYSAMYVGDEYEEE